jgi:hypothetical protein
MNVADVIKKIKENNKADMRWAFIGVIPLAVLSGFNYVSGEFFLSIVIVFMLNYWGLKIYREVEWGKAIVWKASFINSFPDREPIALHKRFTTTLAPQKGMEVDLMKIKKVEISEDSDIAADVTCGAQKFNDERLARLADDGWEAYGEESGQYLALQQKRYSKLHRAGKFFE